MLSYPTLLLTLMTSRKPMILEVNNLTGIFPHAQIYYGILFPPLMFYQTYNKLGDNTLHFSAVSRMTLYRSSAFGVRYRLPKALFFCHKRPLPVSINSINIRD